MKEKHQKDILVYGKGDKDRLLGTHETANINQFSYSVGSRGCSVRVPVGTAENKCWYYEDRRPASNINPYISCAILVDTTYLDSENYSLIIQEYKEFRKARVEFFDEEAWEKNYILYNHTNHSYWNKNYLILNIFFNLYSFFVNNFFFK